MAGGEPTSNHSPSCETPYRRPSSIARSQKTLVEKASVGGSRNKRGEMSWTPVKTKGARRPVRRRVMRPVSSMWKSRSEEHTSELQSLMRISYAVFCLKKKVDNLSTHTTLRQNKKATTTTQSTH